MSDEHYTVEDIYRHLEALLTGFTLTEAEKRRLALEVLKVISSEGEAS